MSTQTRVMLAMCRRLSLDNATGSYYYHTRRPSTGHQCIIVVVVIIVNIIAIVSGGRRPVACVSICDSLLLFNTTLARDGSRLKYWGTMLPSPYFGKPAPQSHGIHQVKNKFKSTVRSLQTKRRNDNGSCLRLLRIKQYTLLYCLIFPAKTGDATKPQLHHRTATDCGCSMQYTVDVKSVLFT